MGLKCMWRLQGWDLNGTLQIIYNKARQEVIQPWRSTMEINVKFFNVQVTVGARKCSMTFRISCHFHTYLEVVKHTPLGYIYVRVPLWVPLCSASSSQPSTHGPGMLRGHSTSFRYTHDIWIFLALNYFLFEYTLLDTTGNCIHLYTSICLFPLYTCIYFVIL